MKARYHIKGENDGMELKAKASCRHTVFYCAKDKVYDPKLDRIGMGIAADKYSIFGMLTIHEALKMKKELDQAINDFAIWSSYSKKKKKLQSIPTAIIRKKRGGFHEREISNKGEDRFTKKNPRSSKGKNGGC